MPSHFHSTSQSRGSPSVVDRLRELMREEERIGLAGLASAPVSCGDEREEFHRVGLRANVRVWPKPQRRHEHDQ